MLVKGSCGTVVSDKSTRLVLTGPGIELLKPLYFPNIFSSNISSLTLVSYTEFLNPFTFLGNSSVFCSHEGTQRAPG